MANILDLFFSLRLLVICKIFGGSINSILNQVNDILQRSPASGGQINNFLEMVNSLLNYHRGEWNQAVDYCVSTIPEYHRSGRIQDLAILNIDLADNYLEINRFKGERNLSEAEAALRETLKIFSNHIPASCKLIAISARSGRIAEAHERLNTVMKMLIQPIPTGIIAEKYWAVAEIALAECHWDEVVGNYESLIDIYKAGGFRWHWARHLIDLGDALVGRNQSGDRERARQVYHESLDMFTEMGAPGYVQVLEERLGMNRAQ